MRDGGSWAGTTWGAHREMNFAVAPGLANLSSYRGPWLRKDIVAGLVLTALLVPQGMAYAGSRPSPDHGLVHTSILYLVGYAIFGPSKILVLGPDSALGPMIAATILPIAGAPGGPGARSPSPPPSRSSSARSPHWPASPTWGSSPT